MPQDRFIHPRLGHSDKVTLLTDFEFRVWVQYLLSADDFGVMRASAVTVQADNDALHAKKPAIVQRALDHLVAVGLLLTFEHQNRRYVCQKDWHDWQHIGYPRATNEPLPPPEILDQCSEKTRALFGKHSWTISEKLAKSFTPPRAREEAKAKTNGLEEEKEPLAFPQHAKELTARAGRLRQELYPAWFAKYRQGAKLLLVASPLEFQDALTLVETWDDARLEKLARIVLTTDDSWISGTDRSFKIFVKKASWADDRLRQAESGAA